MKIWMLTAMLTGLALTGCNKEPKTFGDELSNRSDKSAEIGKQWNESKENVAEGQDMIRKGQNEVDDAIKAQADAQQTVDEGRRQVNEGQQQMRNAENAYQKMGAVPVPMPGQPPTAAPVAASPPPVPAAPQTAPVIVK